MTEQPIDPQPDATGRIEVTSEPEATDTADDSAPFDMAAARRLRHENANLRAKLKAAEARAIPDETYEASLARLAALERREIEREAAEVLIDPSDIYRYSDAATQEAFIDQQFGEIARDPIIEAAKQIARERPHLAKDTTPQPPPTAQPLEGLRGGARPQYQEPEVTWSSALRRSI